MLVFDVYMKDLNRKSKIVKEIDYGTTGRATAEDDQPDVFGVNSNVGAKCIC